MVSGYELVKVLFQDTHLLVVQTLFLFAGALHLYLVLDALWKCCFLFFGNFVYLCVCFAPFCSYFEYLCSIYGCFQVILHLLMVAMCLGKGHSAGEGEGGP